MAAVLTGEIDPGSALSPQVYQMLKEAIIRADMLPGQRLSDIELAKTWDISRQPIREAFMRLQAEDLLDVRPQRGTFVRRISVPAVLDARFVREAIEADIVRVVAESAESSVIKELKALLAAQKKLLKQPPVQFMKLDDEFHRTLAEAAGKPYAWRVIEDVKTQMDRVRFLSFNDFHMERLVSQHADIVSAIAKGQPLDAIEQMRKHLQGILKSIDQIACEFPDFFTGEHK
ncbi:GntR family transcriptional regulator [Granulosicoccus antarcticus]|uniref:HTH-type transcriptional repressor RspR n=1 Tax=Granulosicoccus antarcticus IMCC3135 TaxID=1192854 RepID=A0A2Z2P023_9GAMM|nr:GntR family transcriptional regulator [Granulosicoccus antarcticus]ASJ75388.1 HTH-type transcriptional repressor RspR [Granulosicoccus antarcticus IMCC3135]